MAKPEAKVDWRGGVDERHPAVLPKLSKRRAPPVGACPSLGQALAERATATSELLARARQSRLALSEPTITEVNLVELAQLLGDRARPYKFTSHAEGTLSGADWAWCIGNRDRWITLLVQAKMARGGFVERLHHNEGKQRTLLMDFARNEGAVAVYCIYGERPAAPTTCRLRELPGQSSCLLVSAHHVEKMGETDDTRLETLLPAALPWACIGYCESGSSVSAAVAALTRLEERAGRVSPSLFTMIRPQPPAFFKEAVDKLDRGQLADRDAPARDGLVTTDDASEWDRQVQLQEEQQSEEIHMTQRE